MGCILPRRAEPPLLIGKAKSEMALAVTISLILALGESVFDSERPWRRFCANEGAALWSCWIHQMQTQLLNTNLSPSIKRDEVKQKYIFMHFLAYCRQFNWGPLWAWMNRALLSPKQSANGKSVWAREEAGRQSSFLFPWTEAISRERCLEIVH